MALTLPSTSFVSRSALCPTNSFLIPFSKSDLLVVDVVNKLEGDLRLSSLPAKHFRVRVRVTFKVRLKVQA